ncbi:MAG: protein translocase subunit SecF, partial [Acidimicrobiales bacterium]
MSPDRIRPGSARGLGGEPSPEDVPSRTVGEEPGDAAAEPGAADVAADAPSEVSEVGAPEVGAPEVESPSVSDTGALAERGAGWAPDAPSRAATPPPAAKTPSAPRTPPAAKAPATAKTPATPKAPQAAPAARVPEDARTSGDRAVRNPRPRVEVEGDGEPGDAAPRPAAAVHRGFFRRLYFGESSLDFVGRRRLWFTMSTIVILAGIISLATRGLNLDIEFVGGTSWTVQSPTVTVSEAKTVLAPFNLSGSTITVLGGTGTSARSLEVQAKIPKGQTSAQTHEQLVKVEDALAHLARTSPQQVSIQSVGPSWGGEVTTKAIQALVVFFVLVALYISVFFEWRMALAAIVAVLHDILVTVGIYSLTGFDVTPDTVVAILTILGYSLYDTIVVFDRVRDNLKGVGASGRLTISDVVNLSMNQTLARSINTSLVAIMPIFAVLVLGAEILG